MDTRQSSGRVDILIMTVENPTFFNRKMDYIEKVALKILKDLARYFYIKFISKEQNNLVQGCNENSMWTENLDDYIPNIPK